MNIVYVYGDTLSDWNCSEWRCAIPARAINNTGEHKATLISFKVFSESHIHPHPECLQAGIIIIERCITANIMAAAMF